MTKINPFKPNSPVPTAMFAGRIEEIVALEKGLYQTKLGQPATFLMTGDRGIGKSSLLLFLKAVSVGDIRSPDYDKFDFLSIHIPVSDKLDIATLLKLVERNISREIGKVESIRTFLSDTWSFIQRLRVMDSGISAAEMDSEVELQLDQFSYSLAETCKRIVNPERGENKKDGVLFLFDECDNATPALRLGYFFKTVSEALQRQSCNNVMFVVAGLPDTPEKLSISHESSVRIFTPLKISELSLMTEDMSLTRDLRRETKSTKRRQLFLTLGEPVRNFVCEAYHSAKGVLCLAISKPPRAANRHSPKFQLSSLKSSSPVR